ncbi:MAG: hypothetical protein JWP74_4171 [Marmoricola sp.]|nr:hypothetical protein [Marmoricola sp.]
MKANRLVLLAVAGTCGFALTGCSQSGTVAATVGGTTISTSDVAFLARMQCDELNTAAKDPSQASSVTSVPTRVVRADMVNALVQAALDHQLAKKDGGAYDVASYRQAMDQFESAAKLAPAKDQDHFRSLVGSLYRGQLQTFALADQALQGQGVANPSQEQVTAVVAKLQEAFRATTKVSINPVYGADVKGNAGAIDPSLSLPVSSFAKKAAKAAPDPAWVATLPTNQRCG